MGQSGEVRSSPGAGQQFKSHMKDMKNMKDMKKKHSSSS